jgi:hypothetical protein
VEGNPKSCELGCRLICADGISLEDQSAMRRAVLSVQEGLQGDRADGSCEAPGNYFLVISSVKARC